MSPLDISKIVDSFKSNGLECGYYMGIKSYNGELDHSAKYYPIISRKDAQSIFCVEARLSKDINVSLMQKALDEALRFYPTFSVELKRGYAWHRFAHNSKQLKISDHTSRIMIPILPRVNNKHLMRVSVSEKIVRLEIFHGVCDANVGFEFLTALIEKYNSLIEDKPYEHDILNKSEHYKNSFAAKSNKDRLDMPLTSLLEKNVATIKGEYIKGLGAEQYIKSFPMESLTKYAKKHKVSISAVIVGILVKASLKCIDDNSEKIVIMLPVDLRRLFPSASKRNFVSFVRLRFKNKDTGLDTLIEQANEKIKFQVTKEYFQKFINLSHRTATGILKIIPLWFKEMIIKPTVKHAKSKHTVIFSNIGKVADVKGVDEYVLNLNISKNNPINFGMVSINGKTTLSATSKIKNIELISEVFEILDKTLNEEEDDD